MNTNLTNPGIILLSLTLLCAAQTPTTKVEGIEIAPGFTVIQPGLLTEEDIRGNRPVAESFNSGQPLLLQDGRLMMVYKATAVNGLMAVTSENGGRSWSNPHLIEEQPDPRIRVGRPAAVQTVNGKILVFYYGFVTYTKDPRTSQSDLWVIQSEDGGRTFRGRRRIWEGYVGMLSGATVISGGNIVLPFCYLAKPTLFLAATLTSTDGGETWKMFSGISIGEDTDAHRRGPLNGGALEPVVAELSDGRLLMLIRTIVGTLYRSYSNDGGLSWGQPEATAVSCGGTLHMKRLSSTRLALLWNEADWSRDSERGFPYGFDKMSIALSDDDGKTWHAPVVYARTESPNRIVHSLVEEYAPGELLITMPRWNFMLQVSEKTLLKPQPPLLIGEADFGKQLVKLEDGSLELYRLDEVEGAYVLLKQHSRDGGRTWSDPQIVHSLPPKAWTAPMALLDTNGEIQIALIALRDEPDVPSYRFMDIWHLRSTDQQSRWTDPVCIFEGRVGGLRDWIQLSSGRIVLPHQARVFGREPAPPTGWGYLTAEYSDDRGRTWNSSPAQLAAPVYHNYNGANVGLTEPAILELRDGRIWMLMRTQTGFLYESFSFDGVRWSDSMPSRFHSPSAPAALVRTADGRIVVFCNNCEAPSRNNGGGVYGGRDELHAAISDDEGKTWRGYRTVYRDPFRNQSPPRRGDRGTAYPSALAMDNGKILLVTGQAKGRRVFFHIDPDWLLETEQQDDFSQGLEQWSVFKHFGPSQGWWRDRTQGPELVPHPVKPNAKALHVRRLDERAPDGAMWNFPAGLRGNLTLRLMLRPGFKGARISLANRFFNPGDDNGESKALFSLPVQAGGLLFGSVHLEPSRFYELQLRWDINRRHCKVFLEGQEVGGIPLSTWSLAGPSYLRLRSTATEIDSAGMLVELTHVKIFEERM